MALGTGGREVVQTIPRSNPVVSSVRVEHPVPSSLPHNPHGTLCDRNVNVNVNCTELNSMPNSNPIPKLPKLPKLPDTPNAPNAPNVPNAPIPTAATGARRLFKLFIANIPYAVTEDQLRSHFAACGEIVAWHIVCDAEGSRGFGFVTFADERGMQAGMELNGSTLEGRELVVKVAESKGRGPINNNNRKYGPKAPATPAAPVAPAPATTPVADSASTSTSGSASTNVSV